MDKRPAPLVPQEVDLRDFQYMELDVRVLRDSKFAAEVDAEAFRAGVLLWCAAWHQVPAASLPENDVELSNLAGYGRVVKEWLKVREQALSLFVACSDGRLYHRVIAEKAVAAWDAKLHHQYGKMLDRLRKENKKREKEKLEELPVPSFEEWNSARRSAGVPTEQAPGDGGIPPEPPNPSDGIPPDKTLKGNGTEQNGEGTEQNGDSSLLADGSADAPPPAVASKPKPAKKAQPITGETWDAYAVAYTDRYHVAPVRNAKVNAQLAHFVSRLPAAEAPEVARFYLGHRAQQYVGAMHSVDLLVRDAEKLRTEYITNRQTTQTQAMQSDKTQTNANAFAHLIAKAEQEEANAIR